MKTTHLTGIIIIAMSIFSSSKVKPIEDQSQDIHEKIENILAGMTVEEKVGQMTQIDLNIILKGGYSNYDGTIDPELLELAINTYKVGSILNVTNNAYNLETWHRIITQIQDAALKNSSPIPVIYGVDAIHGASYVLNSTLFPHNLNMAASRNPDLVFRSSEVTARETRASGVRWNFDPVLDLGRNPLWSRFEETYGEDPYLVGIMSVAAVKGYEGEDLRNPTSVASTIKHYLGYSTPRTGRDRTPALIPEIQLREIDLTPYYKAVKAGASSLMVNSGEVNGIPVHGNRYLLTDVLRGELGFEGVIVSDWQDVNRLHERHNIASTLKEAVRLAVLAGIDMSMTPHDFKFAELLKELYVEDEVVAEHVDNSVRRILKLKLEVGLFENPYPEEEARAYFGLEEYRDLALQAARESITLLKNDNAILPLQRNGKILLAGPCHDNIPSLHGSWSYTWQGTQANLYPDWVRTMKQELIDRIGSENVISFGSQDYNDASNYDTALLRQKAQEADHIVLCLGEDAYAESPGAIQDLELDQPQIALAKAAISTGKPVSVVLLLGRPRLISSFADDVNAILLGYRPASMGAKALVEILFGDINPSGKLPFSYPRTSGDLVLYDHKWTELNVENEVGVFSNKGYNPQFEFGHGLSYTSFVYSDFRSESNILRPGGQVTLRVTVTNTGSRSGDEIVELYSRKMYASVVPSMRKLRKFERITLEPGESKTVRFTVSDQDLFYAMYGEQNGQYVRGLEEGEIRFMIGGLGFRLDETDAVAPFISVPHKHSIGIRYVK